MTTTNDTNGSDTIEGALALLEQARAMMERACGIKADWTSQIGAAYVPRALLAGWIAEGCAVTVSSSGCSLTVARRGDRFDCNARIYSYDAAVIRSLAQEFPSVRAALLASLPSELRAMFREDAALGADATVGDTKAA